MRYEKFEQLLQKHNTTAYRVSKDTGISGATFSDWKNGRSTPKLDKLRILADYFSLPLAELFDDCESAVDGFAGYTRGGGQQVPVIGEIRAGRPIITNETLLGYEAADIGDPEDFFYLRVKGDSMKNAGILDGSLVLFEKRSYAEDGDIVACLIGGDSSTVKRFSRKGHRIALLPENPDYEPINIDPIDFETGDARILGVAVEVKIKLQGTRSW